MILVAALLIGPVGMEAWAGHYFGGTATGENHTFELQADGTGKYVFDGCFSGKREDLRWSVQNGRVAMTHHGRPNDSILTDAKGEYLPVRWGEDRLLIPESRILEFTEPVRQGWRGGERWGFPVPFLRRMASRATGNEAESLKGLPELPATYAKLLIKPFRAKLLGKKGAWWIDRGSADGVGEGTSFWIEGALECQSKKVQAHKSEVEVRHELEPLRSGQLVTVSGP